MDYVNSIFLLLMLPAFLVVPFFLIKLYCLGQLDQNNHRLCVLFSSLSAAFNVWDTASHLLLFGYIDIWQHSVGNLLCLIHALWLLAGPLGCRQRHVSCNAHCIVAAVVALAYTELMQWSNIIWSMKGLCGMPTASTFSFWILPGLGLQGPVLMYIAASSSFAALADDDSQRMACYAASERSRREQRQGAYS